MLPGYKLKNQYIFKKLIGSGGMGEVWLAERVSLGDEVAIKVLKLNANFNQSKQKVQLEKEAKAMVSVKHPNICKVHDFVEHDGAYFLVMELLEGFDLKEIINRDTFYRSKYRLELAIYVSIQILRALKVAHNLNNSKISKILHRDIKPANIFLTAHGEVKLLDLGVAKVESPTDQTATNNAFCTPRYTCPDLWNEGVYALDKYTCQHDIYCLGLIFFEILTCQRAYPGEGRVLFENLERGEIASINNFCIFPEIIGMFKKWTHKDPTQRYQEIEPLLTSLESIAQDLQIDDSILMDLFKNLESENKNSKIKPENIQESLLDLNTWDLNMKPKKNSLQITGDLQETSGKPAEEKILEAIKSIFGDDYARVFINTAIPGCKKTPDFVFAVYDRDNEFKFVIVECKASRVINKDGSTKYCDTYEQILNYRERILNALSVSNRNCKVDCYAVFPNAEDVPKHLETQGRNNILWMTLEGFTQCLKSFRPVTYNDKNYEIVQLVYSKGEVLQKYREKINFDKEQKQISNWKFGGTRKIGGLAGTGKSLVLAKKMIKDILESNGQRYLYLTHNNNLIVKFVDYFSMFAQEEDVICSNLTVDKYIKLELKLKDRNVNVYFCTFDAFPTAFITQWLDRELFAKDSWGPLYNIARAWLNKGINQENFKAMREELLNEITPKILGKERKFETFDSLYIDEFQDCRIDASRFKFPVLFVKKQENGEPNLCFTEDPLQSLVSHKILKDLDDSFENVKRKDIASNKDLGLHLSGRSVILNTIYRTPESIFKSALNLLENQGGLLAGRKDQIENLRYKNNIGKFSTLKQGQLSESINYLFKSSCKFPHHVIIIGPLKDQFKSKIYSNLSHHFEINQVAKYNLFDPNKINFFHEYNIRGLESPIVYLVVNDELVEKPNYVYTLMCRTKLELIFVQSEELSDEKFNSFMGLLSSKMKIAA